MNMLVGYARTSTVEQAAGFEAQKRDLEAVGIKKLFSEQVSSVAERAQLAAALDFVREGDVPKDFVVTAWTEPEKEIMGMRHRTLLLEGVQFHPESFLTEVGYDILRNFMKQAGGKR